MDHKKALITGIAGQDGLYLAELLINKGYEVYGLLHGQNNPKKHIVEATVPQVNIIEGDLLDISSLIRALKISQPQEVYNLGAWSFVGNSFGQPLHSAQVTGIGCLNLLEAIRLTDTKRKIKFYQASTSELFGKVREIPQKESTPFHPRSPYANAKAIAHYSTVNYRESYGMFACAGILFNHESPRRGHEFVTRKVTSSAARISLGRQEKLFLGNLDSKRDWGFAGDYVYGMWLMLQQNEPDDYVLATGESHSIRDLLNTAFREVGISDWSPFVEQDPAFVRPAEVDLLLGDASKAKKQLGWEPKVSFEQLVAMMVENDLNIEKERNIHTTRPYTHIKR